MEATILINAFITYSLRYIKVELASSRRIDTDVVVFLPPNSNGFIISRFNRDKLKEVCEG